MSTFEGYHAAKRHARTLGIREHLTIMPVNYIDKLKVTFGDAFFAASLDCKLQCRHFTPVPTLQLTDLVHPPVPNFLTLTLNCCIASSFQTTSSRLEEVKILPTWL